MRFDIRFFQKVLSPILLPASWLYLLLVSIRNFLYDCGFFKSSKIEGAKVISIGNIKAGGTGKTPLTIGVANYLNNLGFKTAIITNAYKAKLKGVAIASDGNNIFYKTPFINDETYLLAKKTKSIVVSSKDRIQVIDKLKHLNVEFIILDDGLQYRKIEKDVEICIIDSERFYLPFGFLRDSKKSLKRCNRFVCFEGDCEIKAKISPIGFFNLNGPTKKPQSAFVFCAIGKPEQFLKSIEKLGIKINGYKFFSDHHYYSEKDLTLLKRLKDKTKSEVLLTTYKDFVKIERPGIVYMDIDIRIDYEELLEGVI